MFVHYLEIESLFIEVWGRQKGKGQIKGIAPVPAGGKEKKDHSGKKSKDKEKNGQIGAAPIPPIQDNKMKDEVNMYKEQAAESEKKLGNIDDYLKRRKAAGHTAVRIEDIEALLAGRMPPGRPVNMASTGVEQNHHGDHAGGHSGGHSGGQESKACTLL